MSTFTAYVTASIRGTIPDREQYERFVSRAKKLADITVTGGRVEGHNKNVDAQDAWVESLGNLMQADLMVAFVTTQTVTIGYEIGRAEYLQKPVLILCDKRSPMAVSPVICGSPLSEVCYFDSVSNAAAITQRFIAAAFRTNDSKSTSLVKFQEQIDAIEALGEEFYTVG